MKIKELSEITGINPETIRSYRLKGLLQPKKDKNGYYEYSIEDYISLAYLRKLRGYDIPLQDIQDLYNNTDVNHLITVFEQEEKKLRNQMNLIQQKIRFIELEKRHVIESRDVITSGSDVLRFQSIDDKIDFYELFSEFDPRLFQSHADMYPMSTPALYIPQDILNGPIEDRIIPMQAGIGTYRYVLDELHIPVPDNAVIVPNGICLSQILRTEDLSRVNIMDLKPMMSYAKEKGYTFHSGTTGYLIRLEQCHDHLVYFFRIRACIEPNGKRSRLQKKTQGSV